jgi:C-8 sterol isomerase
MPRFIFDPDVIHECTLEAIGLPKPAMFDAFADAMEGPYPGVLDRSQPWMYSIAGGSMIQMKLYYASLFEYVMIWGTPIGSEGHSGRHRMGFWDTVLDGEAWYFAEGEFEKRVYRPGDRVYVGPGQACGMNFTNGVWAMEYARGPLPTSMPFGLADVLLSCLDVPTAAQTLSLYTDLCCRHFGRTLGGAPGPVGPAIKIATDLVGGAARKVTHWLVPPPTLHEMPKDNPR